ncbi:MAG: DUF3291 domain-containing protein [Paracoccaceae bacterium]
MHLAEFNIGTLKYDWDDPRIADFQNNLDRVYDVAARSPGYVWHMSPADMETAQGDPLGVLGGNSRTASTLSVWQDAQSLEHFTWNTLHKQFYDRKNEWYDAVDQAWGGHRLVMWWVNQGERPSIAQAAARLAYLIKHGDSNHAFGWAHLKGGQRTKHKICNKAAE